MEQTSIIKSRRRLSKQRELERKKNGSTRSAGSLYEPTASFRAKIRPLSFASDNEDDPIKNLKVNQPDVKKMVRSTRNNNLNTSKKGRTVRPTIT